MSTINDLSVITSVSPDDKFPIWNNGNGVTRSLPVSVLDSRYLAAGDVAALAASATTETFISGTGFTPGTTTVLTLANQYYSVNNVEVFFDAAFQGPDQYTLTGFSILFVSPIPVGVQTVYIRGGAVRQIGAPSNNTVGDAQIAAGSNIAIILNNTWTLKKFGAKVDGSTDDTNAVAAAFASGEIDIYFDPGTCVVDGLPTISTDGMRLHGVRGQSRFLAQNANAAVLTVNPSLTRITLADFMISRAVAATSGGDGVSWTGSNSQGLISNVIVEKCWNGFVVGSTDFSRLEGCIAQNNLNDGFQMLQSVGGGNLQWNAMHLLSQFNGRHGYSALAQGTAGPLSCGTLSKINSFANTGAGFIAIGSVTNPMSGIRLTDFFLGQDGLEEIYLSTYSGEHIINGGFTELCGMGTTGPGGTTPATGHGNGIYIDANNFDVNIVGGKHAGHAENGVLSAAQMTILTGVSCINNGHAFVTGQRNGLYSVQGRAIVQGGTFGNVEGSNLQLNGILVTNGPDLSIGGCPYLPANTGAPVAAGSNFAGIGYPTNYST